jgi:hypothetical protein
MGKFKEFKLFLLYDDDKEKKRFDFDYITVKV